MDVIDDILILILERIDSPVCLVRAASTCKRWHGIIADAGFLRRYRSAHAPALAGGDYFNDSMLLVTELKDRASFAPAAAAPSSTPIDARHFSLDFLPPDADDPPSWVVLDSRGSLLLLYRMRRRRPRPLICGFPDVVVCEPVTRRYMEIPPPPDNSAGDRTYNYKQTFLLDGEPDMAGGRIGMSNFRVLYIFEHHAVTSLELCTGSFTFTATSAGSSSWGDEVRRITVGSRSPSDASITTYLEDTHYLGQPGGSHYFYVRGWSVVVLDGGTGEFSHHSMLPPASANWGDDHECHMCKMGVTEGRGGKPCLFTVFDETMKVYYTWPDGGEWALEKSIVVPEATRALPGYKEEFFRQPKPLSIWSRAPGYVTLTPMGQTGNWWLISVDLETMQVALAEEEMGAMLYRCEIPWPPVLSLSSSA